MTFNEDYVRDQELKGHLSSFEGSPSEDLKEEILTFLNNILPNLEELSEKAELSIDHETAIALSSAFISLDNAKNLIQNG